MDTEQISLSHSKLDLLSRCPQQFYRRYILKEPQILPATMLMGRAFHKALEENFNHKFVHQVDLGPKEIAKIYRDAFDDEAAKPVFEDLESLTEDQIDWGKDDPKELREQGQKALLRYHRVHAPFLAPLFVEEWVEMQLSPDVKFVGQIDLVTMSGTVVDFKLTNRAWMPDRVETSLQPTCYAMLLERPINFDFHFITRNPKEGFGISVRRTNRTSADINWLKSVHIPDAVKLIRSELFVRNPGMQCFSCSHRRGCGYRM